MKPSHRTREPAWQRWLGICLRSLHLAAIVLAGAGFVAPGFVHFGLTAGMAVWGMLFTGLGLFVLEVARNPGHPGELAGLLILVKLVLVLAMAWLPALAEPLYWGLLIASSTVSHAPGWFRHVRVFGAGRPRDAD